MPLSDEVCESLWTSASRQEMGIKFKINIADFRIIANDLYDWRKRNGGFENIQLSLPAGSEYLYMVKKTVELE